MIVVNKTKYHISIGDLGRIPTLEPGVGMDLSRYYTEKELNNSKALKYLINSGKISKRKTNSKKEKSIKEKNTYILDYKFNGFVNPGENSIMSQLMGYHIADHNIPDVWLKTRGEGVTVAIVDTGCDTYHNDLKHACINDSTDFNGHGTFVAGIVSAGDNGFGVVGVAPEAKILSIAALDRYGYGTNDSVAKAIHEAIDRGADIINLSLGGTSPSTLVHNAVKRAYDKNIPVVCAAGNNGTYGLLYPANYKETIAIGAVDKDNIRAAFSQKGNNIDFMAPGVSIASTYYDNRYAMMSGTSASAPWVSGVIALMMSKHRKYGGSTPINNVEDIKEHLKATVIDLEDVGKDDKTGYGLIDVKKVINTMKIEDIDKQPDFIVSSMQGNVPYHKGRENDNLDKEWVEFKNISGKDVNMTGWILTDDGNWTFNFPDGFTVKKGEYFKVRTGIGSNTQYDLFWGYRRAVWNNDGDTVKLFNNKMKKVLRFEFSKNIYRS